MSSEASLRSPPSGFLRSPSSSDEEDGKSGRAVWVLAGRDTGLRQMCKNSNSKECTIPRTPRRIPIVGSRTTTLGAMSRPPCTGLEGTLAQQSYEGGPWRLLTPTLQPDCKTACGHTVIYSGICFKTGSASVARGVVNYGQMGIPLRVGQ